MAIRGCAAHRAARLGPTGDPNFNTGPPLAATAPTDAETGCCGCARYWHSRAAMPRLRRTSGIATGTWRKRLASRGISRGPRRCHDDTTEPSPSSDKLAAPPYVLDEGWLDWCLTETLPSSMPHFPG